MNGAEKGLVTIIVPVYNVEQYLERCMNSILAQTYRKLEIILVDDGSTDHCGILCDEYAAKDSRIQVIHKKNGGLSSARNVALEIAKGEYIGFVDSDDYVHPDMFKRLYEACERNHAEIVTCCHYTERGNQLLIEDTVIDYEEIFTAAQALEILVQDEGMKNYAWDKLYRAELFEKVRYPEGRNYEDIATTYRLFYQAKRVCRIPEYLYYYQIREGSISYCVTDEKWYFNCRDIMIGQREEYEFFKVHGEEKLCALCLARLVPYIYTFLDLGYHLKNHADRKQAISFLLGNREEIYKNPYLAQKDKKLLQVYASAEPVFSLYNMLKEPVKKVISFCKRAGVALQSYGIGVEKKYDFSLPEGKEARLILFELPCFDNLGDHAIAYAQNCFLQHYSEQHPKWQLYVIDGWDTVKAVNQLRKDIGDKDVIFCQGGGNLGNLYDFADAFREKILRAFPKQRILIFPQTVYFTSDAAGEKAKERCRKVYDACKKLILCARDHRSYEIMQNIFGGSHITLLEMKDIVVYLDETACSAEKREGILLCLRSDKESALNTEAKKQLQSCCEKVTDSLHITDTVTYCEIPGAEREKVLNQKWELFGSVRLVVTDRLHGMIFAMITKTPCIVMGNNHHKVRETYRALQECEYLHYADTLEEAALLIHHVYHGRQPENGNDFSKDFELLERYIDGTGNCSAGLRIYIANKVRFADREKA